MSLSTLEDYYYAAQLKTIVLCCDNAYEEKWKEMERECKDIPVQALIDDQKLPVTSKSLITFCIFHPTHLVRHSKTITIANPNKKT